MKRISSWCLFLLLMTAASPFALGTTPTSFRQPHPLAWMHAMPTGELPGWSTDYWVQFELSLANIWNAPHTMTDTRNGKSLEYFADYEQTSAILEFGTALNDSVALSLELPFAFREKGILDGFIDGFHVLLGNRRFNRQFYPRYDYNYSVVTDGEEYYTKEDPLRGLANVKPKIKFWLLKWGDKKNCACGFSISAQAKIPVEKESSAGTTGSVDYYYLAHLGIPFGGFGKMWFTGAYSYLGDNPAFDEWPRRRKYEMYELNFDFSVSRSLGILLLGRVESPYLESEHLRYEDPSANPNVVARNRAASGWNSLVRWRGTNAIGLRYNPSTSSQLNFLIAEDWGIGPYDASDDIYSNGAPDVNFIIQTSFGF